MPLSAHLLMAFVGIVIATTVALSVAAYRSSRQTLVAEALRYVSTVAQGNERTLDALLGLRQQRLEGFLLSVESICAEPAGPRGFGWSEECVATMVDQMRITEKASGARLTFRGATLRVTGSEVAPDVPHPDAMALVLPRGRGESDLLMRAVRGDTVLTIQFDSADVLPLSVEAWDASGRTAEVFLTDPAGRFLTPPRYGQAEGTPPGAALMEPLRECRAYAGELIGPDYRGVEAIHGFQPVPAIGGGCIDAHLSYADVLEEAERLRLDLIRRGAYFALFGALLSLIAANRISAPVRRLARSARSIQAGNFGTRIPLGGPAEVRALGEALAAMAADLSKLVSTEQTARQDAETASRSKDRFLAMVSHELRTPLNAVLGWTRLLSTGYLSEQRRRRALDAIERNAQAQQQLVEDLLDVSRIVAGRLRMERTPVRLVPVIEAAVETLRPLALDKDIELDVALRDDLVVSGDAHRLQQIVSNLLSNAVKFTPRGGSVSVVLRRVRDDAELIVVDTGVGIAQEFLPQLFDWFRQRDQTVAREETGLGLGLGLVKQLVELHGGSVTATSAGEGQGATFIVRIPLAPPSS
jgi:signal transduction histidine kinase